jgi:predicted transcriptional regulator
VHSYKRGLSQIALAEKFGISQPAVSAAVRKGERIVKAAGYELIEG